MKKQSQRPRHIPQRSCVVCRQKMDKRRLTRIVHTPDDTVLVDPGGKLNGRGAYVCDQPGCWQKLLDRPSILHQALKAVVRDEDLAGLAAHKPAVGEI
jgi:uncharacterized protein